MPMLTQDDLKAIGTLVGEQIREEVPKIIKDLVPPMIKAGVDELEERMNVKFDAVHEHMEDMENRLVTKNYLDEKLAFYVKKPF
ncbi:MAG: hypothetical protein AAB554_03565 [Patescibacteria group bacterium]